MIIYRVAFIFAVAAAGVVGAMQVSPAAGSCQQVHDELYGYGPSDMRAAVNVWNANKKAFADMDRAIAIDEHNLESIRQQQGAYFLEHGKTNFILDAKLQSLTRELRKLREERADLQPHQANVAARIKKLQAEYKRHGCGTAASPTPKPLPAEDWAGTYVDTSSHKLEISGSGAEFTVETSWTPSETQGGNSTLHCKASGSTAVCHGSGKYFDSDKTIEVTLETTLRKSGSTIRDTDKILTAACKPAKPGISDCKDLGYTPAVHAGAEFTINVRKE